MATWNDVQKLALSLPEVEEGSSHGNRSWSVKGNVFLWERPLRKGDLEALGAKAPQGAILAARVESVIARDGMLTEKSRFLFSTPHFAGYPAILVVLDRIPLARLEDLVEQAWRCRAPKRVLALAKAAPAKR